MVGTRNWIFCRSPEEYDAAAALIAEALDTDLDWVKAHTRLLVRALEWEANDQSRALLLRGDDLSRAEAAIAGTPTSSRRRRKSNAATCSPAARAPPGASAPRC